MRIQHNIMAMNAYRNYNRNTSALSKNLERLSSGYKINRAGDDAAGLAISEKMRAQITGLEAAQKNVKDGISLVNTAEGAMQEIQDMLNRMVYLAQQSANGTYDDAVDRKNLQKEVDALKSEINRIADSANFNGTKLLDGSLDSGKDLSTKVDFEIGNNLPKVGQTLGVDTVLHNDALTAGGTEFSVDLHNYEFGNKTAGDNMTITIGETKIKLEALKDNADPLDGDAIADAITDGTSDKLKVTVDGVEYAAGDEITINGQAFTMEKGETDGRITFKQVNAPTTEADEVNGSMKVTISGNNVASKAVHEVDFANYTGATGDKITIGDEELTWNTDLETTLKASTKYDVTVDGTKATLTAKTGGADATPAVKVSKAATNGTISGAAAGTAAVAASGTATGLTVNNGEKITVGGTDINFAGTAVTQDVGDYTVGIDNTGAVTITAKKAGVAGNGTLTIKDNAGTDVNVTLTGGADAVGAKADFDLTAAFTGGTVKIGTEEFSVTDIAELDGKKVGDYNVTVNGTKLELREDVAADAASTTAAPTAGFVTWANGSEFTAKTTTKGAAAGDAGFKGDWNVSTTDITNVSAGGNDRLASTYFDLTEEMVTEGSKIRIGEEEYTFTANKDNIGKAGFVDISSGDLDKIAKNLTDAAAKNTVYSVGHDGSRITVTEQVAFKNGLKDKYDLTTEEGIEKSLGFTAGSTVKGSGLMLQIGDTSDKFNQLTVGIGDMHTKAMVDENGVSIADIDISTQEGAQKAVDTIKSAINYVSSVRGDLGAISNRLDHTANNLSVMRENIQDAESTIRDTDIAEEMMSYTKNNILVQSAQAMLAQANQVPQGVLQLLQ